MKRPTPQEILRALADGNVIVIGTPDGLTRKAAIDNGLLVAEDGQEIRMELADIFTYTRCIIEPEPKTWRDKSDEENASAFERMIIGSPEEQSEYARDVAKDELLRSMAEYITGARGLDTFHRIQSARAKAFPEES